MASKEILNPESHIISEKGKKLYCRYWNEDKEFDKTKIKSLVFVVHGLAEHILNYTELAETLIAKGLYVFGHDHVGHGQSEGDRCHVNDFQEYIKDCFDHIDKMANKFPGIPIFLIGHSMGGTIAIELALARPKFFRGVILVGPGITVDKSLRNPIKEFAGRIASRIVPQLHVAKLEPKYMSRDPKAVKAYQDDCLNYHTGVKCRFAATYLDTLDKLPTRMEEVTWPFLILHGDDDKVCHIDGAKLLQERASSKDKQLKVFPGAYHSLLTEIEPVKKESFDVITEWIVNRIDVPA